MAAWYCKIDDVEHGPLSQADLVKMVNQGRLSSNDLVRVESKDKWYKARDVKGLEFPFDNDPEPTGPAEKKESRTPAPAATSATADSLLKGFGRKKSSGDSGIVQSPAVDSWDARVQASATTAMTRRIERKPIDPKTIWVMWGTAAAILVVVLFPPHAPPDELPIAKGWYLRFVFMPPTMKLEEGHGVGSVEPHEFKLEGDKFYAYASMPINAIRLLIECAVVIAIGAAVWGVLAARKAVGDIPDPAPGQPARRREV